MAIACQGFFCALVSWLESRLVPRASGLSARSQIAGLLRAAFLPSGAGAEPVSAATSSLDRAISAAEASLREGESQSAESHYRSALREGWLVMAALERLDGRMPEAREALARASTSAVEDGPALQTLALAYLQMGEASQAEPLLTELVRKNPRDAQAHRLLAQALAATGQRERSVRELEEARAIAPGDPELVFALATGYLGLK